ncbi:hypothetical protein ACTQ4E_01040 [Lawsonibacter sp. LCP25S3_G6]|uniref:hypothetical protein n=1 Tax=unclassified Lawsonibacter TaxID=2617946 RepID=UPI003F961F40
MKRIVSLLLAASMTLALVACGGNTSTQSSGGSASSGGNTSAGTQTPTDLTETQKIIQEAQGMTLEELAKKAIEESNGKMFYGVGNSSRGKSALPLFIEYLQTIDPNYTMEFEWQQPKNNKIFDQLTADSLKDTGTFAMTLIQDGNQIESKMVQTGILDTFIPKDWADANGTTAEEYKGYLPLQTLNKIFMYNNTGSKTYDNCWDFVAEGEHGLFMDIDSEIVGKNFLYMLTRDDYSAMLKEAFEALSAEEQAYFQPTIDAMASEAESLGLGENGKYALAWIKLWVGSYNAQTDDGPICNTLVDQSATDQFGLIVYSKLRSVEESASVSKNNITVAAYNDGYTGMGGFGYCHYLFVTDNSPLPWTACAFIAYMTCTADGFSAWGKDIGGYSSNPNVAAENEEIYHHQTGGMAEDGTTVEFAALNDHGYDWWVGDGKLVLEDPEYCASVSFTVGSWIEMLDKYSAG